MKINDLIKMIGVIDDRKIPEDIQKMMNRSMWSESKKDYIKIGDMHFDHYLRSVNKKLVNLAPSYEELIDKLKGMKFFIVRWCGDATSPSSHDVKDPTKYFNEFCYGDDVLKDLAEMEVGQKYNVDEIMQDIEILRYE